MRIRIALATAMAVAVITIIVVPITLTAVASAATNHTGQQLAAEAGVPGRSGESARTPVPKKGADRASVADIVVTSSLTPALARTARERKLLGMIPVTLPVATPKATLVPAPASAIPPQPTDATSVDTPDWQCIRIHESGDEYNSPAAPSGAYGIIEETWQAYGFNGWPYEAPAAMQDYLALKLYNEYGWQPWSSRFACGL